LSNVYGDIEDYPDRVVPAFAAAAARGGVLRLDGPENVLDFIHLDDASDGLLRVIAMVAAGEKMMPTVHLVSGIPTSLAALAGMAIAQGAPGTRMVAQAPLAYAMREFVGDPARARSLLSWRATVPIWTGVADLISAFARASTLAETAVPEAGKLHT
jgi:nucleoside-diphosphate-sugar epimerase